MSDGAGFEVASAYVTVTIDDSGLEDQVVEAFSAACSAAGAVGGDILMQALAHAAAAGGDEVAGGLMEAVSGAGDAMGAEIGVSLAEALAKTGATAGEEISQQLVDAAATAGDEAGAALGEGLTSSAARIGAEAGQELAQGIESQVASGIHQLPALVDPSATVAGVQIGAALAAGMRGMGAATSRAIAGALTAAAVAAAGEAGGAAGSALAAGIGDGASSSMATAAAKAGEAMEASLIDAMAQAGAAGGDALAAAIPVGVDANADVVAQKAAEAIQAPFEVGMTQVGMAGADAMTAGMSAAGAQLEEEGHAAFVEFASTAVPAAQEVGAEAGPALMEALGESSAEWADQATVAFSGDLEAAVEQAVRLVGDRAGTLLVLSVGESAAESADLATVEFSNALEGDIDQAMAIAGEKGGAAYATSWRDSALAGIDVIAEGISSTGTPFPGGAAAAAQAKAAAAAAAAAEEEEIAAAFDADEQFLQEGIDNFTALSGQALDEWLEQVQLASESARDAFITVYEAVNAQLDATTALTDEQAAALDLMYYRASAEMSSLMDEALAFNASILSLDFTPKSMTLNAPAGGYSEEEITTMVSGFAAARAEAGGLGSELGGVEKAASSATSGFGGMASMMSGPWGMALYGAMAILPMLSGSLGGLSKLFDPTEATLLNVQSLAQALATDGNAAGESTAAFVAQSAATDGLSASAARAGVSLATWTEAVVGNKSAQQQVTSAVNTLNQAQLKQGEAAKESAVSTGKFSDELKDATESVPPAELATNNLTTANQQLMNSMAAQSSQIVSQINAQAQLSQATEVLDQQTSIYEASVNALGQAMVTQVTQTQMNDEATSKFSGQVLMAESSVAYMTQAMAASVATSRESALTSAEASVGLLNLGASQTVLNAQLISAETAYTEAQQGATAYTTAITALYGQFGTTTGAEAAFTTAIAGLSTTIKSGKDAVDQYTTAGAANITAFEGVANAAYTAAGDIYQTTGSATQANAALQTMATRLDTAASKAGLTKSQVQQLNQELFGVPSVKDIKINLDTSQATSSLYQLINRIDSSTGTVTVTEKTQGGTQTRLFGYADGGPVQAGVPIVVGDGGRPEVFVPASNGHIYPSVDEGRRALSGDTGGGVTVHQHFNGRETPDVETWAMMKRDLASTLAVV